MKESTASRLYRERTRVALASLDRVLVLDVNEHLIPHGEPASCECCPLALAAHIALMECRTVQRVVSVKVNPNTIYLHWRTSTSLDPVYARDRMAAVRLRGETSRWLFEFDSEHPVEPFRLRVDPETFVAVPA